MSDRIVTADGKAGPFHLGGPAIFGTEGIAFWDRDVGMVCHAGYDWEDSYGKWLDLNGLTKKHVRILPYATSLCQIQHRSDGTYEWIPLQGMDHVLKYTMTDETLGNAVSEDTKGLYLFIGIADPIFEKLDAIRSIADMKIMWEIGKDREFGREKISYELTKVEMCSMNSHEAEKMFGIPRDSEKEMLRFLRTLPVEFVFYRVGSRGAYGITQNGVWFCPSIVPHGMAVDPSGCGNCSTAAAMYGFAAGMDMPSVIAGACVAAGYNAMQYGVWPLITDDIREEAARLRDELANRVIMIDV